MRHVFKTVPLLLGIVAVAWLGARFGFGDLGAAVQHVRLGYLFLYGCTAVVVLLGYSVRWLVVGRAMGMRPRLRRLVSARLVGDAVSALLPGKVAGDPVRAALMYADGLSGVRASAAVAVDRVMELCGNLLCALAYVSIFSLTRVGGAQRAPWWLMGVLALPLLALLAIVAMLCGGKRPFTPVVSSVARIVRPLHRMVELVRRTEDQLIAFFREHRRIALAGVLGSLVIEALIVVEYHCMLAAFHVALDLPTLLASLLASGVARVVPTPGGLGALEASQVAVLGVATGRPDIGFVVGMIMRMHETVMTLVGFLLLSMQRLSFARLRVLAARKVAA